MTETAARLQAELAGLSARDRADIAYFLLHSLEDQTDVDADTAWEAELIRRGEAIKAGQAKGQPADQIFRELREKHS